MGIRGAKSQAKVSMKHELSAVELRGPEAALAAVRLAEGDLRRAGRITADPTYLVGEGPELSVVATLAADY
jgi:valyl-tRNA synthetase